jgi:hypothetical protein
MIVEVTSGPEHNPQSASTSGCWRNIPMPTLLWNHYTQKVSGMTFYENVVALAVGVVLVAATFLAKGISYGMPPHDQKPAYPATRRIRVVLLVVGLLSLTVGLLGIVRN